jgi:hypothetical protein
MPAIKIERKIVSYAVVKPQDAAPASAAQPEVAAPALNKMEMGEHIERPEHLHGSTYKVKAPTLDHAMYITINDIVLNAGTDHEQRRPFEIFINSKNMDQFQWVLALTRIMSAVFRKGGDITFMVEELKAVFDPKGGYFKPGGVYMNSLLAEIGHILDTHLKAIGMIQAPEMNDAQRQLIADKRTAYEKRTTEANSAKDDSNGSFPPTATLCTKCQTKALVLMDGCQTCLNCGYSKCG